MSKLPKQNQFLDLSDYGRPFARQIVKILKHSSVTPIHLTICFIISGLIAVCCILNQLYIAAAFFLILKSILDAADGELARVNNRPSYTGRYFDSISDILLNALFILTIWSVTDQSIFYGIIAFIGLQLQGSLYNYYHVIMRYRNEGDRTSRIFEIDTPKAFPGEDQHKVNLLYKIFLLLHGPFDRVIYFLDKDAPEGNNLPNWLMTMVSTFGLGFQLLVIGLMLNLSLIHFIIPFFIGYSTLLFVFIGIRKFINRQPAGMRDL